MKWIVLLLMGLFAGCKAPYEFADSSMYESTVDSSRIRREQREVEEGFMRVLQSGIKMEVVIEHYALLPDSLGGSNGITYIAKKEVYRGEKTEDLQEKRYGLKTKIVQDSTSVNGYTEEHANVKEKVQRSGRGLGGVAFFIIGVIAGAYCLRRYLRW